MLNKKLKTLLKIIEWIIFIPLLGLLFVLISPKLSIKNIPKSYTVVTGSMEPTIKAGSVIFVKEIEPKIIKKGDIIAFTSPNNPNDTVIHRVETISSNYPLLFKTKGDNNNSIDAWDVMDVGVKGIYIGSIPYLGNITTYMKTQTGFILIVCLPALLIIISQIINIKKAINEEIERKVNQALKLKSSTKEVKSNLKSLILIISLFTSFFCLSTLNSINASYSDSVTISGINISIKDFVPPPIPALISPSNNSFVSTQNITFDWSSLNDYGNMNNPVYYIYQLSNSPEFTTPLVFESSHLTDSLITLTDIDEGEYNWRVKVCDAVNNCSNWSTNYSFILDKTVPTSIIGSPDINNEDWNTIAEEYSILDFWDKSIMGYAEDNLSGVKEIWLSIYFETDKKYWNGTSWVEGTETDTRVKATGAEPWKYQIETESLLFGTYRITSHAVDNAGNIENSYVIKFKYGGVKNSCSPGIIFTKTNEKYGFNASCISQFSKLTYELTYLTNGIEKGIFGTIDINNQNDVNRNDLILGTCSTLGKVCVYDNNVSNETLKITLTKANGEILEINKGLQ